MRTYYTDPLTEDQKKLVVDNIGLVYYVIKRYYKPYTYDEDIKSIGYIGLLKATQSWNAERGEFSTHAVMKIRAEIHHFFHVSCALKRNDFENRASNIVRRTCRERGEFEVDILQTILSDEDMEQTVIDRIAVKQALDRLAPKLREVVQMKYFEKAITREIAKKQKITTQCVSIRKRQALKKMKDFLKER